MNKPLLVLLCAAALLCGCKHTLTVVETRTELVYNPAIGILTFKKGGHPPFAPREIVNALQRAKIPTSNEIIVNMHRFDDQILIADIAALLRNNGYKKNFFSTDQNAESRGSFFKPLDKPPVTASPHDVTW